MSDIPTSIEITKHVPIIADVDVLVAGAGIAGATAAIAAARAGAKTILIDRFGYPGGNMGPGLIQGAPYMEEPDFMPNGLQGIPGEIIRRCETLSGADLLTNYFRDSQLLINTWLYLLQESGVHLLFNTEITDPLMEGSCVTGLVVENKSGTQAITARVVIDATGDADIVFRAGGKTDSGVQYDYPGLYFAMSNVDMQTYHTLVRYHEPVMADAEWAQEAFHRELGDRGSWSFNKHKMLSTYLRKAWEAGDYRFYKRIDNQTVVLCDHGLFKNGVGWQEVDDPDSQGTYGIVGGLTGVWGSAIQSGDTAQMTQLEVASRMFIFETAQFLRKYVPGFQKSYLHMVSPYFHARGGRSAVTEYPITTADIQQNKRKDDVIFIADDPEKRTAEQGEAHRFRHDGYGYDFPYRQLLPQGLDRILVTGRAAIIQPPCMRVRWMIFLMGQAAGVAAAMAAQAGVAPRHIDVRELQTVLHNRYHVPLGDDSRLRELGILI